MVTAASTLPWLLFALPARALAARVSRTKAIGAASLLRGLVMLVVIGPCDASGQLPLEGGLSGWLLHLHDLVDQDLEAALREQSAVHSGAVAAEVHRDADEVVLDAVRLTASTQAEQEQAAVLEPVGDVSEEPSVPAARHMGQGEEGGDRVRSELGKAWKPAMSPRTRAAPGACHRASRS